MINKKCLPRNCKPYKIASSKQINTLAGTYTSSEVVIMRNLRLPEFDKSRNIYQQKVLVFQSETCKYDVNLGADFLTKTGIDAMAHIAEIQQDKEFFGMDWYDPTCYAVEILDAKYEKVDVDEVITHLTHLNLQQKEDLKQVLQEHTKLFDGTLGVYPHRKFHIDLIPGAAAKHARSYPVPVIHLAAFKKELLHLVEIGVLSPQGANDIGAFSHSWDDHLKPLRIILTKLQEHGFTVNPLKCEWALTETDWLGYWLTPNGLKPWTKKGCSTKNASSNQH
jgi:hypothetical protein